MCVVCSAERDCRAACVLCAVQSETVERHVCCVQCRVRVWGRGVYRVLLGKPEGKRPLGKPRCRWEDNIKMDFRGVGCGGMDWIKLAQDNASWRALINAVMKIQFP